MVKGEATGIQYQNDFELYLKLLLQPEKRRWALEVIDFFNTGVFGSKSQPASQSANDSTGTSSCVRSWEDELLSEIGNDVEPPTSPSFAVSNPGLPSAASNVAAEPSALRFQSLGPAFPPPSVNESPAASVTNAERPRPTLRHALSESVPPSISHPSVVPQVVPINIRATSETSFNGPVTNSVAMANTVNTDLQVEVARLSINPGPPTSKSGRLVSKNTAASGSRSKAKALAAYSAADGNDLGEIRSTIIPAIPAVQPTVVGRTTRSRKKAN